MRILGLDYGDRTVGVAMSDELTLTAQPMETIYRERTHKLRQTLARIIEICDEYNVEKIVIGLPKSMNDEEGIRCQETREFADLLAKRTTREIIFQDERLTTIEANDILMQAGVHWTNRKQYIDKMAASLILRGYLESMSHQEQDANGNGETNE